MKIRQANERGARRSWVLGCTAGVLLGCTNNAPPAAPTGSCPANNVRCPSGACAVTAEACADATLGLSQDAQGVWVGYFENFTFASGSDALRITMSVVDNQVSADVKMGGDNVPLPSTYYKGDGGGIFPDGGGSGFEVQEGLTYHAKNVRWEQLRLKMTVPVADAWKEWCAAFPPSTFQGVTFYCVPPEWQAAGMGDKNCFIATTPGVPVPVDCKLLQGCSLDHCYCTKDACTTNGAEVALDIALRGELADGSALLGGQDIITGQAIPVNLHLTRVSR